MSGWTVAFSPCQITGFFQIHDQSSDPRNVGSTGAGVCIQQGVRTKVRIESRKGRSRILLNGRILPSPRVSRLVLSKFQHWPGAFNATIEHSTNLPVGCGYGTSGAGALSLAIALNEALDRPVSRMEAAQIAHTAEVEMHTGLGTVASEYTGGLVVRLKPGAPGVGVTMKIPFHRTSRVVSASLGPFRKSRVLGNQKLIDRVNTCGKGILNRFMKDPREETFLQFSKQFDDCLSLETPRLEKAIKRAGAAGVESSMMMLGESLFSIVDENMVRRTCNVLRRVGLNPIVSRISVMGARLE